MRKCLTRRDRKRAQTLGRLAAEHRRRKRIWASLVLRVLARPVRNSRKAMQARAEYLDRLPWKVW